MLAAVVHTRSLFVSLLCLAAACSRSDLPVIEEARPDLAVQPDAATLPDLAPPRRPGALYIVAHEDDELLFMNPTMDYDIQRGVEATTLFLTAGDAGNPEAYWKRREAGVRAAHALMAHASDDWIEDQLAVGSRALTRFTLRSDRSQHLLFLRLPDGNGDGSGFNGKGSLQDLWQGKRATLQPADGAPPYTQAELVELLATLLTMMQPESLHIQDCTNLYAPILAGGDHSDHVHAARFALVASQRWLQPHALMLHRGYNIGADQGDLSGVETEQKWGVFATYAPYDMCFGATDPAACLTNLRSGDYGRWCERESVVQRVVGGRAALGGPSESCLTAGSGAAVDMRSCQDADTMLWDVLPGGQVRGPGGRCLRPQGGAISDGTLVELAACQDTPEQQWRLLASGQLLGPGGLCLATKGGSGADATPVQLSSCAQTAGQSWVLRRRLPFYASVGTDFSDADLGSSAALARTMRLGDINGDRKIDTCIRKPQGVFCALGDGTGKLTALRLWSEGQDFSDAAGWSAPSWGSTLQLADVNGDGRVDLCGRTATGLFCALSDGAMFRAAQRFSQGSDFGDSDGRTGAEEGYYGSLRMGDVNGDGKADACVRKPDGVYCALSSGSALAPARRFAEAFTDAEGWRAVQYGSTLRLGDVNGDGRADLCGRGVYGLVCILATMSGDAFAYGSWWTFRGAFSNADGWDMSPSLYGSIRLADLDGDGRADVCGRSANGLVCALSTGHRFGPLIRVGALEFADGSGWRIDRYGPTLQLADVDGDGRADACGRGTNGVLCVRTATLVP